MTFLFYLFLFVEACLMPKAAVSDSSKIHLLHSSYSKVTSIFIVMQHCVIENTSHWTGIVHIFHLPQISVEYISPRMEKYASMHRESFKELKSWSL